MGWEYSLGWMVTLPFEIVAAGITLEFWKSREEINPGVWCAVFMTLLIIIQIFGVRGYGEGMILSAEVLPAAYHANCIRSS